MSVFAWFNSHIVRQTLAILLRRQFTSNPFRGVSLLASTGPAGQALSPLSPEGKGDLGESGGAPSLRVKKGTGDDFRRASPSRRGRVR